MPRSRRSAPLIESMMVRKSTAEVELIRESARWCEYAHRLLQDVLGARRDRGRGGPARRATRRRSPCSTRSGEVRRQLSSTDGVSAGYRGQIGKRSSWAHAIGHNIEFQAGDVLVSETSAPIWGYNAELERAMIIGEPTDEMRRLFNHTVAAQQAAYAAFRPGATCADIDQAVMRLPGRERPDAVLAPAHRPRDRPPKPRAAVPRHRRLHADRARDGVHDRARRLRQRARRLPPFGHGARTRTTAGSRSSPRIPPRSTN